MSQFTRLPGRARTDLGGRTVLVIEDEFTDARDTEQALRHAGARVIGPYADGVSALRAVANREPSCAVVDINLSDGVRFSVASALQDKGVPFMFVTGLNPSVVPEELKSVPLLRKPVDYRQLLKLAGELARNRYE